jgi:predicted SPOUT superfamily RNA methylase MTH1
VSRQLSFRRNEIATVGTLPPAGSPPRKQAGHPAVGHVILVIVFHVLKRKENYVELGVNYFDEKNADALNRSLVRRLERLGQAVILTPVAQPA